MPVDQRPLAIFLMGPTASGKTELACALAQDFPLALISVDSALVYRGLDIGSAKPDAAMLARFPHRLIDIRDPALAYSAAEFRTDALREMQAITAAGAVPLLVGGTGLYFRALQGGLSQLPGANAALRESIAARGAQRGWPALHAQLARVDPAAAARIASTDAQRIQRALEVVELTGRPLSQQQAGMSEPFAWRVLKLALLPGDRVALHERIAVRVEAMLMRGLVEEVRALRARADLTVDLPAIRAVGYRQVWQHLAGEIPAGELRDRIVFATRQLAKRQLTWLRSELDVRAFAAFDAATPASVRGAVGIFLDRAAT